MSDVSGDYLALRREVGGFVEPVDVVLVDGDDASTYLQGQLSQDVVSLADGESAWSLLLEPQGKLVALVRVWRRGEGFVVEADAGAGERVLARLQRFLLRVKVELDLHRWRRVSLRGPGSASVAVDETALVARSIWPGLDGIDIVGSDVVIPAEVRQVGDDAVRTVRVESGWPSFGAEIPDEDEPSLIPAELGAWLVDRSASFTKGCYTGQELVARVESRGSNTPRHLRGLVLADNVLPPEGAVVSVEGEERGRLTSVGESLDLRAPVALGMLHRSVEPGAVVALGWRGPDDVAVTYDAQVRELPLVAESGQG